MSGYYKMIAAGFFIQMLPVHKWTMNSKWMLRFPIAVQESLELRQLRRPAKAVAVGLAPITHDRAPSSFF
ncbi:hypothetical protein D3C77_657520 [compost metagenome]